MKHLYGPETKKALENFTATGRPFSLRLAKNIALIKKCAADANAQTKKLDTQIAKAIKKAADEIIEGKHDKHFVVDAVQGGAGTSMNMNVNEVIAKRATQILKNKAKVHSLDHVNLSQSTNDVVPSALKITTVEHLAELYKAYEKYHKTFLKKAKQFDNILKVGRTHLQDAVPMTLGQEFHAHATAAKKDMERIEAVQKKLYILNIGGTAVGTGLNASKEYANIVLKKLQTAKRIPFKRAKDLVYATQYVDVFVETGATLMVLATNIVKCMHDMRILASGPKVGFGEITFPEVQKGSSIMPGKVNPVMSEYLNQIALQVIGNTNTIALTAQAGQLELNVMMPTLAENLLQSLGWLTNGIESFTEKALIGVKANKKRCEELFENSYAPLTALTPEIGYEKAAELAKKVEKQEKTLKELVIFEEILTEGQYDRLVKSKKLTI